MHNILAIHPLFSRLSDQERADLVSSENRQVHYAKGAIVHLQNEQCNALEVILDGVVVVQSIDEHGNVLTLSELGPGETIGLNLLFSRRNRYPMTITAKTTLEMLHLQRDGLIDLCLRDRSFLLIVLQNLSDRSVFLADRIKSMAARTIRQAIVEFLIHEYQRQGSSCVTLPCSKRELAERLGIPRTSLSRELQKMRRDGLIDFDRSTVLVHQAMLNISDR